MRAMFVLPLLALTTQAYSYVVPVANNPNGLVKRLEIFGCGEDITARLEKGADDPVLINRNLVIDFGSLYLGGEDQQSRLACIVYADVQIGAGLQFRINDGAIQGYAEGKGLMGSVAFDYNLDETRDGASVEKEFYVPSGVEDFSLIAKVRQPRWTSCSDQAQVFRLSGSIYLDFKGSEDSSAVIRITGSQQSSNDKQYGVGWRWSCQRCSS